MLLQSLYTAFVATSLLASGAVAGKFSNRARHAQHQADEIVNSMRDFKLGSRSTNTSSYRFYNNKTEEYFVKELPDVPYDLGEMYSGLVPIDTSNKSRALFFVFQPTTGAPVDEITIWLNGGPGCSSLLGFFQENGRFLWQPGTYAPTENPYAWTNLTNMLWVEQPVGTGFSIGTPTATSQEETAQDFIKFFKNWSKVFGVKNFKIYVAGESYAGRYVPYISAAMLDANDTTYYNLSGALVYDPCIGQFDTVQEEIPAVPFLLENNNMLNLNQSYVDTLVALDESCGYKAYREQYFTFPASGVQPALNDSSSTCDVLDLIDDAAMEVNPCFNIYEVNAQCPLLWDVLAFPTQLVYQVPGTSIYFNRTDVKKAMHAPMDIDWSACSSESVFVGGSSGPEGEGDNSADPIQHVLPQVIEATNRVLVSNGDFDMIILTNGTLLAIQNMTWNGKLGFDEQPATAINIQLIDLQYEDVYDYNGADGIDGAQGIMGIQHYERGLMWAETFQSGHEQPEFQPRVTYRHLQWLLGHVDVL
ncbi:MAG: hypothetical protein M1834_007097 [Cirrosporium novae-zelandiae]|nr:MAG: hypothetical protein M1834_007097 [Cirrosporium novae-zelandiae]